ncbi:CAP-Gly domain-containing linker protein 4-like [Oscarella lobularis]|uniref:CAP-Gly domain-containing linker protein 4-like n=1 Tax=Oscarella lobularis TaxID=121494 RepID=UPI0033133F1D
MVTTAISSGFTLVDFTIPTRETPMVHPIAEAPKHQQTYGKEVDAAFFDPNCPEGQHILQDPKTTIPQLFAIMRQWVPQIQKNMVTLANEVLRRGAHIEDRDSLTDHTLLHYACKSAACGVGDEESAAQLVSFLIEKGASVASVCQWTSMGPLHYAAYFNSSKVIEALVKIDRGRRINDQCVEFNKGTALHIAAEGLCKSAAESLIALGADASLKDERQLLPWQCVPSDVTPEQQETADQLREFLRNAAGKREKKKQRDEADAVAFLASKDLKLGDRVIVGGTKYGTLQFCGETKFAPGRWVGIELEEAVGKNDGGVEGVYYFRCKKNYGLFAPVSKIAKAPQGSIVKKTPPSSPHKSPVKSASISPVKAATATATSPTKSGNVDESDSGDGSDLKVGDYVLVGGSKIGTVRFIGNTQFASGTWFGVEFNQAIGKNDGTVGQDRYFTCPPKHGIFAPPSKVVKAPSLPKNFPRSTGTPISKPNPPPPSAPAPGTIPGGLTEGTLVYFNGEIGTLRFVGTTEFADGIWLGVELRKPSGKNDGSVKGKRYFTCKPNYGILVRPNRVTVRGINASRLLTDDK